MTTRTLENMNTLQPFIGRDQMRTLKTLIRGEEGPYFCELMETYARRVESMPKTYETQNSDDPVVTLHYFVGGADWWIIEKDSDPDSEGQIQAYGYVRLHPSYDPEAGYICLPEALNAGAELDLHFKPRPISNVLKEAA